MSDEEQKQNNGGKSIFRVTKYSRRQVLKSVSILTAGAALASVSLASACKSPKTTSPGTTTPTSTENTTDATSEPPVSSTNGSTTPTSTSTTPVSSTPATTGYSYIPPTLQPQTISVPGTTCTVATDRSYSADHIWVKSLSATKVVMGITPSMVEILGDPHRISMVGVGTFLSQGDSFGTIEGFKMTTDLISPVSGQVIAMDNYLVVQSNDFGVLAPLSDDPFNSGWMVVVQISIPNELKSLLTAQAYVSLLGH